jgi:hypothetical protein
MREKVHYPDESGRFYDGFPDSSMSGVAILPDPFGQTKERNAYHLGTLRFPKGSLSYDPAKTAIGPRSAFGGSVVVMAYGYTVERWFPVETP